MQPYAVILGMDTNTPLAGRWFGYRLRLVFLFYDQDHDGSSAAARAHAPAAG